MTTSAARPQASPDKAPKKRPGLFARIALKLGPSIAIGLLVAWLVHDKTHVPAWQLGLIAGVLFFFAWQALSLRMRKAGRSAAHAFKSFFFALLFLAVAGALMWFLWLR